MENPTVPLTKKPQTSSVHDHIGQVYYSHGLFCASHPYPVILITLSVFAICSYPVLRLPLLGSSSQYFTTPFSEFVPPNLHSNEATESYSSPHWFQGPPVAYVQQAIVKSAVSPWKPDLILTDAFRAPLSEAFRISRFINNHQVIDNNNHTTAFTDICLQVSEPKDRVTSELLPQFSCLFVAPTNIWKQDFNLFQQDPDIIKTVFSLRDSTADSSYIREILFGVPWTETGIKQFNIRSRPRVLTYAFTIVFEKIDSGFLYSLFDHLQQKYTSSPYPDGISYTLDSNPIYHVHFEDSHALSEFVPLGVAYVILFLYIYFSVRKIDQVKSKWALAISAVITVVMSLLMSVGLCLWFGLHPTLNGSEIFPYLIFVIGLENMLILTKSVVSTPDHLDTKLRVAQGLCKEGWSITKNLLTELALLTVAFLTFVPKIQEFCLFAVVGLLTDFFLQLLFFATFLSLDIRRIEISDLHRAYYRRNASETIRRAPEMNDVPRKVSKSMPPTSHHKSTVNTSDNSAKVFAPSAYPVLAKLPKRMKFIYFWARTRMVQRGLMVCLVVWICFWAYTSRILLRLSENSIDLTPITEGVVRPILQTLSGEANLSAFEDKTESSKPADHLNVEFSSKNVANRLKHRNLYLWQNLHPHHWNTLFGYYNVSLSGRYISVLPPIHLSLPISPNIAKEIRHPADFDISKKSWKFLSPIEQGDKEIDDLFPSELTYHPSSPAEVGLAIALAISTLLFLVYIMVVMYRCMCTRHYAEWRTSWKNVNASNPECQRSGYSSSSDSHLTMETLPIKLQAHSQEVENIVADRSTVVSYCLNGDICVWDSVSGDCLASIKRSKLRHSRRTRRDITKETGSFSSDSTYSSSPLSDDADTYFSNYVSQTHNSFGNSSVQSPSSNSFMKQFSFDESVNVKSEYKTVPNCKYDFSKFVSGGEGANRTPNGPGLTDDFSCKALFTQRPDLQTVVRDSNVEEQQQDKVKHYSFCSPLPFQPIWAMDFFDMCIAVGCQDGRLEVWNAFNGNLEYVYDESKFGITSISLADNRIVAARLNGVIDFFAIEVSRNERNQRQNTDIAEPENNEMVNCYWFQSVKAHNLAVSCLEVENGFVVTGGFDRLVKVFKCESATCIYTFHGHSAPVSALHIDEYAPSSAASGCLDGLICLWDLMTGTCMYSITGHQGAVLTLNSTSTYMISQGMDNRICIWEKCQGHLLHSISQDHTLHSNLVLLTSNIMVTTKEDNLVLWDVNHGEALRMIMVGNGDHSCHIKLLRLSGQSVVCDYGPQMFVINFPAVSDKSE